jgi:lysophospholipid acyltransferase (LPLAT)-like uncharacterized protein
LRLALRVADTARTPGATTTFGVDMRPSRRKKKFRRLRDLGKRLSILVLPPIYNSYLRLVDITSKTVHSDLDAVWEASERGENTLWAVWHQDAILGPYAGRGRDVITMISKSDFGNVVIPIMRKLHYIPVRGGPKNHGKEALSEIIEYINTRKGVICGIAVDGSRGPARNAQIGIVLMAQATGAPIFPARLWAKRGVLAPTWDKVMIPLPFNHLVFLTGEPIHVGPDDDRDALENHRAELERRLNELADRADNFFRKKEKQAGR